jgi:outer membrane protein OmpA-like peptidoglycan-associated protein
MNCSAETIIRIAKKYNYTMAKVKQAIELLGHTDEELIHKFIDTRGQAVMRYVIENGVRRRQTDQEFINSFKLHNKPS